MNKELFDQYNTYCVNTSKGLLVAYITDYVSLSFVVPRYCWHLASVDEEVYWQVNEWTNNIDKVIYQLQLNKPIMVLSYEPLNEASMETLLHVMQMGANYYMWPKFKEYVKEVIKNRLENER